MQAQKNYIVWCILMIISCQVPQAPIKDEKMHRSTKNDIELTKKKETIVPIIKHPLNKLIKPDSPKIQTKSGQFSKEMNSLANGIKVIIKEIEEPVGRDQSQTQVESFVLQKAKRLAVEEAGTYICSLQVVKEGQMTKEQVNALASGILQTEIMGKPQIRTENGVMFVKVKARIQVDTSVLERQVETLMKNESKQDQQQKRIKELESQISGSKQSDIKRLETLNAQALAIEKQREKQSHSSKEPKKLEKKGNLNVNANPNAHIRILNIKKKFYQGIPLHTGKYRIEVTKYGYEKFDEWITVNEGQNIFDIRLNKNKSKLTSKIILDETSESEYLIRSIPKTVPKNNSLNVFNINSEWKPKIYVKNEFLSKKDSLIVIDEENKLMWQKKGSQYAISYKKSLDYIKELNSSKFSNYSDWRLPTIPELLTIVEKNKQNNDLYINPIFDSQQKMCWSSDLHSDKTYKTGWSVCFECGCVLPRGCYNDHYVRAVRISQGH